MIQERLARVRKRMLAHDLDQIIVTQPQAIYYLTGLWCNPMERLDALIVTRECCRILCYVLAVIEPQDCCVVVYRDTGVTVPELSALLEDGAVGVDGFMASRFLLPLMQLRHCPWAATQIGVKHADCRRCDKCAPEKHMNASVLIDRKDGEPMDTDTCADVSHAIDPVIDEADPIDQSYYLEVGSPGLGRRLTREEHYELLRGEKVAVHFIRPDEAGRRDLEGILTGREGSAVTLDTAEGPVTFEVSAASYVKLCDDEDLF